ncbi:MAG: hypothetical protein ACOCWO_00040 [Candidatus Muiribacteriaceae bacterium]
MKKVFLVFKAGEKTGTGHMRRVGLIRDFLDDICEVRTYYSGDRNMVMSYMPDSVKFNSDSDLILYADQIRPDVIIIDRQRNLPDSVCKLKKFCDTLILIEDDGPAVEYADAVFDANRAGDGKRHHFFGPDWVFLSENIAEHRKTHISAEAHRLFVCMGGTDVKRNIPYIIGSLRDRFELFILPGIHYTEYLNFVMPGVNILRESEDFYATASACDIALVSGGMIMHEMCALCVPSVVWPQVEHQEYNAVLMEELGLIVRTEDEIMLKTTKGFADNYLNRQTVFTNLSGRTLFKALKKVKKIVEDTNG